MSSPFAALSPETVMQAVESLGFFCDARIYPLNSYENRVYQVGLEEDKPIIAKFYRPQRWSEQQIREEHRWTEQLAAASVPVVAPIKCQGETLFSFGGFNFALYPKSPGAPVAPDDDDHLFALGQVIGNLHQHAGALFSQRLSLAPLASALESRDFLMASAFLSNTLRIKYQALSEQLINAIDAAFNKVDFAVKPLHGDFHIGNVLWSDGPVLVDFDDAQNGPAVQDLWMLLSGDMRAQNRQLANLLEGYEEFCEFDDAELALIPSLRALRVINYSAWLARRWQDSAFPKAFPWFNSEGYWDGHLKQLAQLAEEIKTWRFNRGQLC